MDEGINNNFAEVAGVIVHSPVFSHENRGEKFYTAPISIRRLSGTTDTLNVILREKLLTHTELTDLDRVHIFGQLRSFNNKTPDGARLVISIFARDVIKEDCEDHNDILLRGTICKSPTLRRTPLGREICDFMLAVNRRYGRSDYIPCIAWGQKAREIAKLSVGTLITVSGRFQSRPYAKLTEDGPIHKIAYEVSVVEYE